jgi:hypothetical protein
MLREQNDKPTVNIEIICDMIGENAQMTFTRIVESIPFNTSFMFTAKELGLKKKDFQRVMAVLADCFRAASFEMDHHIKGKLNV